MFSQAGIEDSSSKTFIVGVAGSEPFAFPESEFGISIDIREKIAKDSSWTYNYTNFSNVDNALDALEKGNIDAVIGPITIRAHRMERFAFSQPFYNSSIPILSRIEDESIWQGIKGLFSFKLCMVIGIFLIILAIVRTLLWPAESKKSPDQFSEKPLEGIGTGMWLAIVTMSTTGYGDKAPVTLMGRIVAGSWMVISLLFATTMIAGIASTLTLSNVENTVVSNIEQLSGKNTATISGSLSQEFLREKNAKVNLTNNLKEAIEKLESKEVDAVVFDRPQLLYHLKEYKNENLYISKAEYFKQGYGFAFPLESQLVRDVNLELLRLSENQDIETIVNTYIQKDE
ncbi:Putative ligand gated channel [Croceitalea dokdonensis DOKDO 023]|uniref:Putative ligand gated channel n=1 Tax=Croceitalea dokdonensis DOKDO 023 TaxID=1300341 RepID=A0A0P7AY21_9FLAO|nr:transporter substrate-binding domain-containing protein [Croceitalea dokdonensis]KPM31234.1 Putative ligand gated channel [Croceitalea dokdonensis DOKDO 023]